MCNLSLMALDAAALGTALPTLLPETVAKISQFEIK
jgi:hypothetical protein